MQLIKTGHQRSMICYDNINIMTSKQIILNLHSATKLLRRAAAVHRRCMKPKHVIMSLYPADNMN